MVRIPPRYVDIESVDVTRFCRTRYIDADTLSAAQDAYASGVSIDALAAKTNVDEETLRQLLRVSPDWLRGQPQRCRTVKNGGLS